MDDSWQSFDWNFFPLFQEKTNALVETIRLFEKGLSSFEGADRVALEKHLIKTLWWQFNNFVSLTTLVFIQVAFLSNLLFLHVLVYFGLFRMKKNVIWIDSSSEIMSELLRYVCQEQQLDIDVSKELNADQVKIKLNR